MNFDYGIVRDHYVPNLSPFPHPFFTNFQDLADEPKCLEEWNIIYISQLIREKPEWKRKYRDETIVAKWKAELEAQFKDKSEYFEEVWAYALKELEWYERMEQNFAGFQKNGFVIGCDDKVVYSDTAVDSEKKETLKSCVKEFVDEEFKDTGLDYHPGSNDQVVDIVHPSLYPLQYDETPYYPTRNTDSLTVVKFDSSVGKSKYGVEPWAQSKSYQWLPALMSFQKYSWKSKDYFFQSYINNLHPKYEKLYHVIEDVFNASIPGLNLVLSRYKTGGFTRIPLDSGTYYTDEWEEMSKDFWERANKDPKLYDDYDEFFEKRVNYFKPLPIKYELDPPVDYTFDLRKSFAYLKVIVKLANIELTPEKPNYEGGSWHVEGTINEDIVATVLYYYDSENISESRLSFRTTFEDPNYEQGDELGVQRVYGFKDGDIMNKRVGDVKCQEDRLLIFPNGFQHHVDPFELKDKSKSGHRKILCMFLVDPYNKKVVTTAQVPPQQPSWHEQDKKDEPVREQYKKEEEEKKKQDKYYHSPDKWDMFQFFGDNWRESVDKLKNPKGGFFSKSEHNWPISLDSAKDVRKKLMEERKVPEDPDDELAFTREFSLCEH